MVCAVFVVKLEHATRDGLSRIIIIEPQEHMLLDVNVELSSEDSKDS